MKILKTFFIIVSASVFLIPACSSSGKNANTVYIDPDSAAGGNGTIGAPFSSWSSVTFSPGFSYLQKCGTVAEEQIFITGSGTEQNPITLGSYGSGAAPVLLGSEMADGWTQEGTDPIYSKSFTFSDPTKEGLGMAAENGTLLTFVKWTTDYASTKGSILSGYFTFDPASNKIYIRCASDANPSSRTIEVSRRLFGIRAQNQSHIIIRNLAVKQVSLHGMQFENCTSVSISGCSLKKLGGAVISSSPLLYAGNGIEFGNSCTDCSVTSCTADEIFDSGFSPQIYTSGNNASGFVFDSCTAERCGFAGIEIANLYNGGNISSSLTGITVRNCTVSSCGFGWSGTRYATEGRGIKINADISGSDNTRTVSGVIISKCLIQNNAGEGIFVSGKTGTVSISQTLIKGNSRDGIRAQEPNTTDLRIDLSSSIIRENGAAGFAVHVQFGNGYSVIHNTFYNNSLSGIADYEHSGNASIVNNIFHSSSAAHLYIEATIDSITNNYFRESAGMISYNLLLYSAASAFNAVSGVSGNIGSTDPLLAAELLMQNSSPCYHTGKIGTGITADYTGKSFAVPPSIGAYEL